MDKNSCLISYLYESMYNIFMFNYSKYKKIALALMNIEKIPELHNI
jgi:hypothetical protein